jgi:5-methylcytosine-specific restriction protein A
VLVDSGRCPGHQKAQHQQYDSTRGNSSERGYTWRWRKYRTHYLSSNPLCAVCRVQGIVKAADCVDHITPVKGADDPLFWEPSNHQPLCTPCHSVKTATEDGGFGNKSKG